jgi:hypothetical protein
MGQPGAGRAALSPNPSRAAQRPIRERVAAWEAQQARERAEIERAAEMNAQIRREVAERNATTAAEREEQARWDREAAERPAVGMPSGWRVPELK